jgi:peptidoglycan L-alanyl-D-glutamate endopeptidase CwlK
MATVKDQAMFLLDFCKLIQYATSLGFVVSPGELLRTKEQQEIYVKQGRSRTMFSRHLDKMAGDLNFFFNGVYINRLPAKEAIKILESIGRHWERLSEKNRWGGNFDLDWTKEDNFKDVPHFERKD